MSGRQLLDWQAYARQYGLPNRRNDLLHGMAMALQFNMNRAEDTPAEAPAAFMPYYDSLEQDISKDEFEEKMRGLIPRPIHKGNQQGGIPSA